MSAFSRAEAGIQVEMLGRKERRKPYRKEVR
jgi:hypothetical protein